MPNHQKLIVPAKPKVLIWDIECSGLQGDFATVLTIGSKWLGESKKNTLIKNITNFPGWRKDTTDDSRLVKWFYPRLVEADVWVTFFGQATMSGKGFDEPMIVTKLLEHQLPPLPDKTHIDLYRTARRYLRIHSRRLASIAEFLPQVVSQKTPILGRVWKKAGGGHKESILELDDHCRRDVWITEEVYYALRPYIRDHPRLLGFGPCRFCGSTDLKRQGYKITRAKGRQIQIQCKACGAWDSMSERDAVQYAQA